MTSVNISPNMNLPVPVVGTEVGPDWATDLNACLAAIDSHDHGTGQGVHITPDGIDINSDLPMNDNDLTTTRTVRFASQAAVLSAGADIGCLYEVGTDLYFNDGAGNQVRITQAGSVTGATGTITGLPSGTASASFAGGTFSWRSATNTPATMSTGPLVIGAQVASPHTVTIGASAALAADFTLTLPLANPAATSVVTIDSSGQIATTTGPTLTSPAFVGVPTGTITGAAFSPTVTWTKDSGASITFVNGTSTWYYLRIGNTVKVDGSVAFTYSGGSGTSGYTPSVNIPIATAALAIGGIGLLATAFDTTYTGRATNVSTTAVKITSFGFSASGSGSLNFSYSYLVS